MIPSMFTAMNLFCGFLAILRAADSLYEQAAMLIVLGGVFDALDGMMARLTNSSSEFGVELDSLADVVSFCVAPSVVLYFAFFRQWSTLGMILAAMPAICGALRLARFNVQLVGFSKNYFRGLPTPAAAYALMGYLVFNHLPQDSVVPPQAKATLLTVITAGISLLMVSTIRYQTMPAFTPRGLRRAPLKAAVVLLAIVVSAITLGKALFPVMALYIVGGAALHVVRMLRHNHQDDSDTMEQSESTPFDL